MEQNASVYDDGRDYSVVEGESVHRNSIRIDYRDSELDGDFDKGHKAFPETLDLVTYDALCGNSVPFCCRGDPGYEK